MSGGGGLPVNDSLNMLDPGWNESRRGQFLSANTSFNNTGYIQTMSKKSTVKELLTMKRACQSEQKWTCSQDDELERKSKFARFEAFDSDTQLFSLPEPVNPNSISHFFPENVHETQTQIQDPAEYAALLGQKAPTPKGKMTLFHWQIQQEAQKVEGLSPEQLIMQDADGDTYLHIAVAQGKRALAYVLAAKMAGCGSLDMKERNGQTALHIAAATNQHLIIHDLLVHGAQINIRDLWGRSPLHICAEKGHLLSLQSIWKTLTDSGQHTDIEMFNYDGLTPLHVAVLSHNSVVKEMSRQENTCFYKKMELDQRRQMYAECIQTLLPMGASCGTRDLKSGRTCLHMVSEEANMELLNIFLNQPTSLSIINSKTFSGNTALHIVSSLQTRTTQVEAVKLLMRQGADPGAKNLENELPVQLVPEGLVGEKVRQILKGKRVNA